MRDKRLNDPRWRKRVGFDNIALPRWSTPKMKSRQYSYLGFYRRLGETFAASGLQIIK